MTTARQRFVAKRLVRKYGVVGRIASLYIYAGYSVAFNKRVGDTVFDVIARGHGNVFAIKIVRGGIVEPQLVEALKRDSEKIGAKPIIVLYGAAPRVAPEAIEKAREAGVLLKRVR